MGGESQTLEGRGHPRLGHLGREHSSTGNLSIISAITDAGEPDPVRDTLGVPEALRGVVPAADETVTSPHKWGKGVDTCSCNNKFFFK